MGKWTYKPKTQINKTYKRSLLLSNRNTELSKKNIHNMTGHKMCASERWNNMIMMILVRNYSPQLREHTDHEMLWWSIFCLSVCCSIQVQELRLKKLGYSKTLLATSARKKIYTLQFRSFKNIQFPELQFLHMLTNWVFSNHLAPVDPQKIGTNHRTDLYPTMS